MLSSGTILQARYRIVRQLGQGGMGAVYEAIDERLDTVVALKETLFAEERLRKQFEREARLLARLHHQALPRVSDHFNEGDGQFLVMQYIAGEDLFEMLARQNGPFSQEEVLRWADQLCDALDYLHTQDPQIIHRDIKPQNLKMTSRGQVVLLDFGLAKGSAGQMSVVTTSASIFGYTPNYAPLEQVQGLGTDARSDIYSLAATLYHLITNVKPPDALSRASAIVNGVPDPLMPANLVSAPVSSAVANVLGRGMSQKRDDRFASAAAMRDALRIAAEQPLGDAATVMNTALGVFAGAHTVASEDRTRLVAGQTKAFGNEAQTLLAADATQVRGRTATAGTVGVDQPASGTSRARIWLAAAVFLVLVAGCAGAFYAYRARSGGAVRGVPAPTPQASPQLTDSSSANDVVQTDPAKTSVSKTEKSKVEAGTQKTATKQPVNKDTETTQPLPSTPRDRATAEHDTERNPDPGRDANPAPSPEGRPFDPLRNPQVRQPGHPAVAGQLPDVRIFPNGTRVVRQPDGTLIMTLPDGTTRIVPRGKLNLRRNRRP